MSVLNLFPSRIRFTNPDGTLTPEAYRTLNTLFADRLGGALGDSGASGSDGLDAFMNQAPSYAQGNYLMPDTFQAAPDTNTALPAMDVMQPTRQDNLQPEIYQPATIRTQSLTDLTVSGTITNGDTFLLRTSAALPNGAAALAGTLLNAPTAGNPTKWIPINDNGTTRYIPSW